MAAEETGGPQGVSNPLAELARRRYQLRAAVVRGRVDLPVEAAARLIGPDCAYHLYGRLKGRPDPARATAGTGPRPPAPEP